MGVRSKMFTTNMNLLEKEQSYELPVIASQSLRGNEEVHYNTLQLALIPHIEQITFFWWAIWVLVLSTLVVRGVQYFINNSSK